MEVPLSARIPWYALLTVPRAMGLRLFWAFQRLKGCMPLPTLVKMLTQRRCSEKKYPLLSVMQKSTGGNALPKYPYPKSLEATTESFKNCDFPSLKFIEKKLWKNKLRQS
jgi:hypothetical protein